MLASHIEDLGSGLRRASPGVSQPPLRGTLFPTYAFAVARCPSLRASQRAQPSPAAVRFRLPDGTRSGTGARAKETQRLEFNLRNNKFKKNKKNQSNSTFSRKFSVNIGKIYSTSFSKNAENFLISCKNCSTCCGAGASLALVGSSSPGCIAPARRGVGGTRMLCWPPRPPRRASPDRSCVRVVTVRVQPCLPPPPPQGLDLSATRSRAHAATQPAHGRPQRHHGATPCAQPAG